MLLIADSGLAPLPRFHLWATICLGHQVTIAGIQTQMQFTTHNAADREQSRADINAQGDARMQAHHEVHTLQHNNEREAKYEPNNRWEVKPNTYNGGASGTYDPPTYFTTTRPRTNDASKETCETSCNTPSQNTTVHPTTTTNYNSAGTAER